jgi:hypothetical protein
MAENDESNPLLDALTERYGDRRGRTAYQRILAETWSRAARGPSGFRPLSRQITIGARAFRLRPRRDGTIRILVRVKESVLHTADRDAALLSLAEEAPAGWSSWHRLTVVRVAEKSADDSAVTKAAAVPKRAVPKRAVPKRAVPKKAVPKKGVPKKKGDLAKAKKDKRAQPKKMPPNSDPGKDKKRDRTRSTGPSGEKKAKRLRE